MYNRIKFLSLATAAVAVFSVSSSAQNNRAVETRAQEPAVVAAANPTDALTNELSLLRKTLQSLNTRLRDLNPNSLAPTTARAETPEDRQKKILKSLEVLNATEQRAELLRKQLVEAVEKENSIRSRVIQLEEDMRPENIDRNINSVAFGTRAPEQREARKRSLENERNGLKVLLSQVEQSRLRLEDDVRHADNLVVKLRQRVLPLIEREVDNLVSN